jgi:hypothetical protein
LVVLANSSLVVGALLSIIAITSLAATKRAGIFYTHKLFLVALTMSFHFQQVEHYLYIKPCDFLGSAIRLI